MERPELSNKDGHSFRDFAGAVGDGKVVEMASSFSGWREKILGFLREEPESSLLTIVLHLWPNFLSLPPERRARAWFWTKEQMHEMTRERLLSSRPDDDGIQIWSVTPVR